MFTVRLSVLTGIPGGSVVNKPTQKTRVRSLEEQMAIYSNILAWKIPWAEKPRGLQSIESQRVGHD